MSHRVLIVDDEKNLREGVRGYLAEKGYEVLEADSCGAARKTLAGESPDAAILDYRLPDGTALDLLGELQAASPPVPSVILTGHGTIDLAVRAIKEGADQFLTKPVEVSALAVIVERLVRRRRRLVDELVTRSRRRPSGRDPFCGTSAAIRALAEETRKLVTSESPILILGETGVGKGLLARWIHDHGPRAEEPFVDLNCAALSKDFLESQLFGHERGAFTGAVQRKAGLLEVAHRGSVFLDEIGDVAVEIQPQILKVLEEKRFRRLGDVKDRSVDIRLIAATHQDLHDRVRDRRFRSDLYFRISTLPLRVPALRERPEDVPELAHRILDELAESQGRPRLELAEDAERALVAYSWPGNIRELRNVLERAVLLSDGSLLRQAHLRLDFELAPSEDGDETLLAVERRHIARVLRDEHGHVARTAERLGVPLSTLYKKLARHGLRGA